MDRYEMLAELMRQSDANDAAYIRGEFDKAKWVELTEHVNERLAIFGLQFIRRPWETGRTF